MKPSDDSWTGFSGLSCVWRGANPVLHPQRNNHLRDLGKGNAIFALLAGGFRGCLVR